MSGKFHRSSKAEETTPRAYRYGLLDPLDWDQDCHEQLFLMNAFWNSLVEIERNHRDRYRAIIGSDERVATLQTSLETLRQEEREVRTARKQQRQRAQKRVDTPELDARLHELGLAIRPLSAECKAMRTEAAARMRKPLRLLDDERHHAVNVARQRSGLWWGNYTAVLARYDVARIEAIREGGELRFRRFSGEGLFMVYLSRGASVDDITSGKKQVSINLTEQPVPGRAGKHRPQLAITIYTRDRKPRLLTFPLIYDRPLPAHARIKQVTVVRRRIATKWRYAAIFTLRLPETAMVGTALTSPCGINLGFRQTPTGLRIATVFDGTTTVTHELPAAWMEANDDVDTIQQRRSKALNAIAMVLKTSWPDRPVSLPEPLTERIRNLVIAPKFGARTLARLTLYWRAEHALSWPDMLGRLENWRRIDKRDLEIQENKRDHLAMSRLERYRLLAKAIASSYAHIRIGKINLQRLARLEMPDGTEAELHLRARRNRARASLYRLQQEIKQQASKRGAIVEYVDGPVTVTCHSCGGRCGVTVDLIHTCEHCLFLWDQDENAARNIFAASCARFDGAKMLRAAMRMPSTRQSTD